MVHYAIKVPQKCTSVTNIDHICRKDHGMVSADTNCNEDDLVNIQSTLNTISVMTPSSDGVHYSYHGNSGYILVLNVNHRYMYVNALSQFINPT